MDCPINSILLDKIFEIMKVEYDFATDSFTNKSSWEIRIEDQHDENEPEPHYILIVGEEEVPNVEEKNVGFYTRYCDYYSCSTKDDEGSTEKDEGIIKTNPGTWRIYVWLSPECRFRICNPEEDERAIAIKVDKAYKDAMKKTLPDYEIIASDLMKIEEKKTV